MLRSRRPTSLSTRGPHVLSQGVSTGAIVQELKKLQVDGKPLMADAFPAFAITLERFCDE